MLAGNTTLLNLNCSILKTHHDSAKGIIFPQAEESSSLEEGRSCPEPYVRVYSLTIGRTESQTSCWKTILMHRHCLANSTECQQEQDRTDYQDLALLFYTVAQLATV